MRCAGHGRGSVGGTLLGAGGAPEGPWRRRRVRTRTLELYLSILFLLVVVVVVVVVFVVAFFFIVIFLLVVRVVVRQRIGLKECFGRISRAAVALAASPARRRRVLVPLGLASAAGGRAVVLLLGRARLDEFRFFAPERQGRPTRSP